MFSFICFCKNYIYNYPIKRETPQGVKNMKKKHAILFGFLLATLISMSTLGSVQASISGHNWIKPTYRGTDNFYGTSVVAYETGSEATLVVSVLNNLGGGALANVSAVKVGFDWGINYTSTECSEDSPVQIQNLKSRVFTVTFTVPATTVASNMMTHTYTIYVEHVNSTTGPKGIVGTWTWTLTSAPWFVVYSANQADAQLLLKEWTTWNNAYTTPLFGLMPTEARKLWIQSSAEKSMGDTAYTNGDFTEAKTHYSNALNFTKEALTSEVDKSSSFEDSLLSLIDSAGSYLSMQGMGFIVIGIGFGIGFLLMGIGVVIYLVRKSGAPAKAKA